MRDMDCNSIYGGAGQIADYREYTKEETYTREQMIAFAKACVNSAASASKQTRGEDLKKVEELFNQIY